MYSSDDFFSNYIFVEQQIVSLDSPRSGSTSSEDTYVSSNEASGHNSVVTVRKPRKKEKDHVFKPRALKYDIRRSYAAMFTNVMNSMELPLMFGFLDTYFSPGFKQMGVRNTDKSHLPTMTGIIAVTKFWWDCVAQTPDMAFELKEVKIYLPEDSLTSRIVAKFSNTGTRLYSNTPVIEEILQFASDTNDLVLFNREHNNNHNNNHNDDSDDDNNSIVQSNVKRSRFDVTQDTTLDEKLDAISRIYSAVETRHSKLPKADISVAQEFYSEFEMTMYVDANNLMTKLVIEGDFDCCKGRGTPLTVQ